MTIWSICGELYCGEQLCGVLPWDLTSAICGECICGEVICGANIPINDDISAPIKRKLNAIAKIYKSDGNVYELSLISANVKITNPPDNDEASFEWVSSGGVCAIGDRIQLWIGYPGKYLAFVGDLVSITRDESGITKANVECIVDTLKYIYLKDDKSYSEVTRQTAISDILTDYNSGISYDLNIKSDASFKLTKDYWAWNESILDIIKDIMWDHNIYYIYKTLYIENPDTEINLTLDYTRSKFESWSYSEELNDQFGHVHIEGSDHSKDKYCYNTGKKEFSFNDMTMTTQDEVDRIADILSEEKNKTLYNVQIKLPYLIPPRIGKVHVKLPGLDEFLIIKEINYEVSGTSLSSTLTLGSHRSPISSIMNKLIKMDDKSHFVY